MTRPRILVTGATGRTGAVVVSELLSAGYPVRAMVRAEDARSRALQARGAEIALADMCDAERVADALKGVQRAYYVPPFEPNMLHGATVFATAAKDTAGMEHIVSLTQWLASPSHPALMTRYHWLADRVFAMLPNVGLTILNPGFFADAYLQLISFASLLGVFPMPGDGESRNAPPSNEDIARVAAVALMDPGKHAGKTYRPTGPQLLSVNEMIQILSRVLHRKVRHVPTPMWLLYKSARRNGFSELLLNSLRHYLKDHNSGAFALGAPTNDVLEVTGRRPEDFETIARRYAAHPNAQQTIRNQLAALADFMLTPFRQGFDPDQFDRELRSPQPMNPKLVTDSDVWRREHGVGDDATPAHPSGSGPARLGSASTATVTH
jgi:NAD(P)H dehydrogenase (quinone)